MRLVYFGTPEVAVVPLRALHAAGHEIVLVVSRGDTRRGRGSETSASPVKAAALELGLPVTAEVTDVLDVSADLGVVVAYGRIITPVLLAHLPMVNLHFSLLPRWRGAAPVERAILSGDAVTGVCVMAVDEGLDTGAVFARAEVSIDDTITADELRSQLVSVGTTLLVDTLLVDTLARGLTAPEPQPDEGVTYAHKLTADDHRLDWNRPVVEVLRVIRLGGARTTFRDSAFKVLAARLVAPDLGEPGAGEPETAVRRDARPGTFVSPTRVAGRNGDLELLRVQPAGKPAMEAAAWANGARPLGGRLGA